MPILSILSIFSFIFLNFVKENMDFHVNAATGTYRGL